MAHAAIVEVGEIVYRLHLTVLALVVEPSRAYRHVTLGRSPGVAVGVALLQLPVSAVAGIDLVATQERPVGGVGIAFLVAHPATAGAAVGEDDGLGLQTLDHLPRAREIIIGAAVYRALFACAAVIAVAAVGTVKPYLEDVAILGEQFFELCVEVLYIQGSAVESLVTVPGREIDAKLESVFLAGCRQFAHDVALAVLVGGVAHAVVGILGGPEAEAVVVLGGDDDALHAGVVERLGPLLAVEAGRVETLQRGVAISPLAVAKGVGTKVDEGIGLHLLPSHLVLGGQRRDGRRSCLGGGLDGHHAA